MYGYKSWTIKKAEHQRIDAFELWCWRTDSWESLGLQGDLASQSWRKSVLNILWKNRYWNWTSNTLATRCKELTHWKRPWYGEDWRHEEKGTTEDEMIGWYQQTDGHKFEQSPGVGDGQGSLVCCSSWGYKESDMTQWLNRTVYVPGTMLTALPK